MLYVVHMLYRVAQKIVSYCILSISSLNIDQFLQFFTGKLCIKKLATQWHAQHTYYVAGSLMVQFEVFN